MREQDAYRTLSAAIRNHLFEEDDDMLLPELPEAMAAPKSRFPEQTPLAMAYVPVQHWDEPYQPAQGLQRGTIFPALDFPFGGSGNGGGCCEAGA